MAFREAMKVIGLENLVLSQTNVLVGFIPFKYTRHDLDKGQTVSVFGIHCMDFEYKAREAVFAWMNDALLPFWLRMRGNSNKHLQ